MLFPLSTLVFFFSSFFIQFLPFPECHIVLITWYVAFSYWFLSLSNVHLRFLYVFSWLKHSFLCSSRWVFLFLCILGPHVQHMEVPRLQGSKLSCSCRPYTTATATQDRSQVCDLHHSSWQRRILNPPSKARNQTCILRDTSWVHYC